MKKMFLLFLIICGLSVEAMAQNPKLLSPGGTAFESYRAGTSYDLIWDTTTTLLGQRFKFQFAASALGPWTDCIGATNVLDSNASSSNRRGRFNGGFRCPSVVTSTGYLRMINIADTSKVGVSLVPFSVDRPNPSKIDSILSGTITNNVYLSNTKIYGLRGFVHVVSPATLTIQAGTVIVGDTVGVNSALVINRGAKIIAIGTPSLPIIMTSSASPGQRRSGDWGGLLIYGKAPINNPGGEAAQEGGVADINDKTKWYYGGTDFNDNSGVLKYVRVEFGGIALQPNQELNGITLGGVGRGTTIDYVQSSYANDDGFEWFGGSVDAKHIISNSALDDDFDTDNGFSGRIQYAISQRSVSRADQSTSQTFESDNDATATFNQPLTSAIFSNVTAIGPLYDTSAIPNARFGAGAQIRRNSRQAIYNSVFLGWPRGIEIAQTNTMNAANVDSVHIRNTAWYGYKTTWLNLAGGTPPSGMDINWIAKSAFSNNSDKGSTTAAMLENPFAEGSTFSPAVQATSPLLTGATFVKNGVIAIDDAFFEKVDYRGAMGTTRWDYPWANYDPINTEYKAQLPPSPKITNIGVGSSEVYRAGVSYDLKYDTLTTKLGQVYKFQYGTSNKGPWIDLVGATAVKDSNVSSTIKRGLYQGGFRAPSISTTTGYLRMVNIADTVLAGVTNLPFTIERPSPTKIDSIIKGTISSNMYLSNNKIYGLSGYVHVVEPAILTIQAGTIIVGDTVGVNSALVINRGGKIIANGTASLPIIMTSSAPPGQRRAGDWGGLLIYGKAPINNPGGEAAQEGGVANINDKTKWYYGGTDFNDNSGVLKYVRVEFGGIALQPNQELNGITLGGVGRGTTIDYVQSSYANDDGIEWFGGSVDAKHLIVTGSLDDDFDTDNGFSGRIQYAISQRFSTKADQSTSQAFESDNDATATFNQPLTTAIFSNVTAIGPLSDTAQTPNARFGAAAQIRRNSRLSIFNSAFIGWPRGMEIAQANTMAAANVDSLQVKNSSWFGVKSTWLNLASGTPPAGMDANWLAKAGSNNFLEKANIIASGIQNPFSYDATFNPSIAANSPLISGASFTKTSVVAIDDAFFDKVAYRGAMDANRWDIPWANYDPINAVYTAQSAIAPKITSPGGTTNEVYRAGISYDLKYDTITTVLGQSYKFQFGTSKTGPWLDLVGATSVKDSNVSSSIKRGIFVGGFRAPSIETKTGYIRMVSLKDSALFTVSANPITIDRPSPTNVDSVLSGTLTKNVYLSNTKIYGLRGYVHVVSPAVLTIQAGTIIVGDTVGVNSALVINRGAKIIADGKPNLPIVMTSSAPAGQRRSGDWGGLLIYGKARINNPGSEAAQEGGVANVNDKTKWYYGGGIDDDNSGILRYVRVEFGGIALQPNQELNGITLGGVGRGTIIDNVQSSYANDDGIEWFGGTVDAKHLIVTNALDDDFDTDNGYSGRVQFAIAQRFKTRADQSTSQTFESDNDATSTYNQPYTSAIFSNVTSIGPLSDTAQVPNARFGAAAQIRRNTHQSIFNSVFVGWPRGIEIAQANTMIAAYSDTVQIRNNSWYGVKNTWLNLAGGTPPTGMDANWIAKTEFNNVIDKGNPANSGLENIFAEDISFNPVAKSNSPVLTGASFTKSGVVAIDDSFFEKVAYRGAMDTKRWDLPWANYDPINTNYKAQLPVVAMKLLSPGAAANEIYRAGSSYDIVWDTTTTTLATRHKFQFGTSATGPWIDLPGATNIIDSNASSSVRRGRYLGGFRAPAVETSTGYIRMVNLSDTTKTAVSVNPFKIERPSPSQIDSVLTGSITNNVYLSNTKIYGLRGFVHVVEPAVLTIQAGTIILGDTVGNNSALVINRGAKIIANGTPTLPIVMTSSAPPGQRRAGDWGGLLIYGKARINNPGGEAAQEGGVANVNDKTKWYYGGTDDNDNSGSLQYVRIEFGGIALQPNQELNGLTLGAVGRGTSMDNIQVSYANDDGIEWFGGSVDGKHLIVTGALDDDFDTDNGFSGRVQFAVSQRFKTRADQSTSQAFESDNDATATFNTPFTSAIFSNVTSIGPLADTSATPNARFGAAAQIRRNSRQSIMNSLFIGWPRGIEIAQVPTMNAALADSLQVRNNSWFGIKGTWLNLAGGTPPAGIDPTWISKAEFGNTLEKGSTSASSLENPFIEDPTFNPAPKAGSPVLTGASFTKSGVIAIDDVFFEKVAYRGAMGLNRWDLPWSNYDPINTDYKAQKPSNIEDALYSTSMGMSISPNPTNDIAKVQYELKSSETVSIKVYNASGTIASSFINNQQQLPGFYEFSLNLQDVPSGVYYVQIITQQGTITKAVSVIR